MGVSTEDQARQWGGVFTGVSTEDQARQWGGVFTEDQAYLLKTRRDSGEEYLLKTRRGSGEEYLLEYLLKTRRGSGEVLHKSFKTISKKCSLKTRIYLMKYMTLNVPRFTPKK